MLTDKGVGLILDIYFGLLDYSNETSLSLFKVDLSI